MEVSTWVNNATMNTALGNSGHSTNLPFSASLLEPWEKNLTFTNHHLRGIASDELKDVVEYVANLWLCSIFSYVGIVGNIIAFLVFRKMGFQETINISLAAIAFWDAVKALSCAVARMYGPIKLVSEALAFTWSTYSVISTDYVNALAGYVSGVLAAYVAVERCLCVAMPFTVKFLLTRKLVTIVNIVISLCVLGSYVISFAMHDVVWVFNPKFNATVAEFAFSSFFYEHPAVGQYSFTLSIVYPFVSFIITCICTVTIVYNLHKASKIRSTTTSKNKNSKQLSTRDKQITKMLLIIILVYIVSYAPKICFMITVMVVPEFWPFRRYANIMWITSDIMFVFDSINAAVNPFIFYFMSSQYRCVFKEMFLRVKNVK